MSEIIAQPIETQTNSKSITNQENDSVMSEEVLMLLGEDPNVPSNSSIKINPDINPRWKKWITDGLGEEQRNALLKMYVRNAEPYAEPPKINKEIIPAMTEIAIKRDEHFIGTQKCVGSAIISLGAALSMLLENPEEGIDQLALINFLWDTSKLLTEVFFQQSISRKAFITPLMDKTLKPVLEATKADQWLYGEKFPEQIKEAKTVKSASNSLKAKTFKKPLTPIQNLGNWKGPPVRTKQVGGTYRRPILRFKQGTQHKLNRNTYRSSYQTLNQKLNKK